MRANHRFFAILAVTALALCLSSLASAQSEGPQTFNTWLRVRGDQAMNASRQATVDEASEEAIPQNGSGVANQVESPSTDQASTSLVDTSSASDFVSLALNLAGISGAEGEDSTSGSVTATLYSLIAAAKGLPVTDPAFYKQGTRWRRLAFTIGTEESKPEEHFTDKPSTNVGAKFLILNHRDVYSRHGQTQLDAMSASVMTFQQIELRAIDEIQCLLFRTLGGGDNCDSNNQAFQNFVLNDLSPQNWPATLQALEARPDTLKEVDRIIERLAGGRRMATEEITRAVEKIQRGRQLSLAGYTKQREDDGTDEHRGELIFDYGLSERLNWTVNASFDYRDRKTEDDTSGGRFATELQAKLTDPRNRAWGARPVMLSASSEATRASGDDWLVRAQVKLTVPITTGMEVPIAYTYANRDADGIESGSQLKLSLAVDPVRLREWLTRSREASDGN